MTATQPKPGHAPEELIPFRKLFLIAGLWTAAEMDWLQQNYSDVEILCFAAKIHARGFWMN